MGAICPDSGIILSCFLILPCLVSLFSDAADTLMQGQSIKDGETLISNGGVFELGFFSPGNSTKRYVGIWYHNVPTKIVVWVANRGSPLTDLSGNFTLQMDGNLVLQDRGQSVMWSSNSSVVSNKLLAQLMDSGDLVLKSNDSSATVLWESFDHPTDTFLPGMKLIMDKKTGKSLHYISWKNPDDPNYGNYSFSIDPLGSAQIFIWEGSKPRWRSGPWNGETFIGAGLRPLYVYGYKLTNDATQGKLYFTFTPFNTSLLRFVMQWDGSERSFMLVNETKEWRQVYTKPSTECEIYNKCGKNAKCTDTDFPICSCLNGFEPMSNEEWSSGRWSGGCVRRSPLKCETNSSSSSAKGVKKDGFLKWEMVKLPDQADWASLVVDASGCEEACLKNCTCKAYAYVSGIGCLMWGNDLLDIQQLSVGGKEVYVKLADSEFVEKSSILVMVLVPVLGVVFLGISVYVWWNCKSKIKVCWEKQRRRGDRFTYIKSGMKSQPEFSGSAEFGEEAKEGNGSELTHFQFQCIISATNNFSNMNKLGEGGFGPVYKGSLSYGQEIAVKRLSKNSGQGLEEFKNEVMLIARLQHRNLVRLLGYCIQGDEQILAYEYMPNKGLDAFLFDPTMKASLDWRKRFNIIEGIARGVLYLHRDSRLRIVHRDLKASNILLDNEMNPKISDFGMARIFGGNQDEANTNRVVGTFGYMSPEYAMQGLFSEKSDVYSFGVLVLEIVSSQKNRPGWSFAIPNLLGTAWRLWKEDKSLEFVDPSLCDSLSTDEILRCIQIGLLCVQDRASDRPTMSSVVSMLGNETSIALMPKQPTFTVEESSSETESLRRDHFSSSTNELTITRPLGR